LAPLAGWTDGIFRRVCREFGAGMCFTEMVSADGIVRNQQKTLHFLSFNQSERPIAFQLFGSDAESLAGAAEIVSTFGPDFIDINFGCPVKKVVKRGAGSALLKDLDGLRKIARAVVDATDIPVTAKIRSGWDRNIALDICHILEDAGIAAITIHPRTRAQAFGGKANWEIIAEAKRAVSIPVIGNGDIKSPQDAVRMLKTTDCDLVMVGRAARGNPWIFNQINELLSGRKTFSVPTYSERIQVLVRHLTESVVQYGEGKAVRMMRKHAIFYLKGMPEATKLRVAINRLDHLDDVLKLLKDYSEALRKMDIDYLWQKQRNETISV